MSETTEIKSARIDQLADRLQTQKGNVLAIAQLPEPHLALVCVEIKPGEYVTWQVNLQVCLDFPDCGCGNGHYFTAYRTVSSAPAYDRSSRENRSAAMRDFRERFTQGWALFIDAV